MINMELLNVIRRMSLRLKLPIREIARRTGLSRNTVKKHLKADTIEPTFAVPDRPSKLDPFAESKRRLRPIDFAFAFSGFGGWSQTDELVGESLVSSL